VCCEDKVHCCPNGYQCNVQQQTCNLGFHKIAFVSPVKALKTVKDVPCPGGQSACPDNTTCCVLAGGDYGCCPYPQVGQDSLLLCRLDYICFTNVCIALTFLTL